MATKFSDGVKKLKVEMLKNHFSLNLTGIVEQSEGDGTKTVFVSSMVSYIIKKFFKNNN